MPAQVGPFHAALKSLECAHVAAETMLTGTSSQHAEKQRLVRRYADALKRAGIARDDLQLLRDLAEMNVQDLVVPQDHVPPSRLLL